MKNKRCDNCKRKFSPEKGFYFALGEFCSKNCMTELINKDKSSDVKCFCCDKIILKNDIFIAVANHIFCREGCIINFINSAKEKIEKLEKEEIIIDIDNRQLKARNKWLEKRHQELMAERKLIRRMLK